MAKEIRNYKKLATDILQSLGGKEHIMNIARCATRLRLVIKDQPEDAKQKISALSGVIAVVEKGGQLQIVIGTHVGEVYQAFCSLVGKSTINHQPSTESVLNRVIATMSAVFAPFIYVLAAAGILQGCLILARTGFPSFEQTGTHQVLSFISWAPFIFLPIFIAITASNHFKCNLFVAVACCCALVSPQWTEMANIIGQGRAIEFLGISLSQTTYTSSVLPPLFLVWILSYLEHFLEPRLNDVIKPIIMPFICIVIMVPLTILFIGPLSSLAAKYIAFGYNWLVEYVPFVASAIIGGLWQVLVIFGVHWGITPVIMSNFELFGKDSFQVYQSIAVTGQVGAVIGFYLKTKNSEMKKVSISAFMTGLFGITEPAIYGVNLRFKQPFIYGCVSGMVGAIVASFFNPYYYAYAGLPGPLTMVNGINHAHIGSFIGILIGILVALILPVILMQILGTGEKDDDTLAATDSGNNDDIPHNPPVESTIYSPLQGKVIPLADVPDPVFAEKLMGEGIAIEPSDNHVYAPFDGQVKLVFEQSKHAIGLLSNDGIEILIHVGIDTVKLTDSVFTYHVALDQTVKKGDLLISFDAEKIRQKNCPLITPVVLTDLSDCQYIITTNQQHVTPDDILVTVKSDEV
jgi:beta-glucoside PTS system EIICBA component